MFEWFTYAFWQIVWIPNILVRYHEDGRDDGWNMLVINNMW